MCWYVIGYPNALSQGWIHELEEVGVQIGLMGFAALNGLCGAVRKHFDAHEPVNITLTAYSYASCALTQSPYSLSQGNTRVSDIGFRLTLPGIQILPNNL